MVGLRLRHHCDNDAIDGQRGSSRQLLEKDIAGKNIWWERKIRLEVEERYGGKKIRRKKIWREERYGGCEKHWKTDGCFTSLLGDFTCWDFHELRSLEIFGWDGQTMRRIFGGKSTFADRCTWTWWRTDLSHQIPLHRRTTDDAWRWRPPPPHCFYQLPTIINSLLTVTAAIIMVSPSWSRQLHSQQLFCLTSPPQAATLQYFDRRKNEASHFAIAALIDIPHDNIDTVQNAPTFGICILVIGRGQHVQEKYTKR